MDELRERARRAVRGLATRGLLVRHLVMPGMLDETRAILEWLARDVGTSTYVNLMDQYRPDGRVPGSDRYGGIDRRLRGEEFREAKRIARAAGLRLDRRRPLPISGRGRRPAG